MSPKRTQNPLRSGHSRLKPETVWLTLALWAVPSGRDRLLAPVRRAASGSRLRGPHRCLAVWLRRRPAQGLANLGISRCSFRPSCSFCPVFTCPFCDETLQRVSSEQELEQFMCGASTTPSTTPRGATVCTCTNLRVLGRCLTCSLFRDYACVSALLHPSSPLLYCS